LIAAAEKFTFSKAGAIAFTAGSLRISLSGLAVGALIGEAIDIESRFEAFGEWLKGLFKREKKEPEDLSLQDDKEGNEVTIDLDDTLQSSPQEGEEDNENGDTISFTIEPIQDEENGKDTPFFRSQPFFPSPQTKASPRLPPCPDAHRTQAPAR
jgi:hypothetical protein